MINVNHTILNFKSYLKENRYWGNGGAGILLFCSKTKRFLLPLRSSKVKEPHTWGIWGGKIEDDEFDNIEAAAEREFKEETGYTNQIILKPLYVFKDGSFEYHNFLGIIEKEFYPKLNWETKTTRWVDLYDLIALENKHFGLVELLKHSLSTIKKYGYINQINNENEKK
jgi:8-oxo-dGTP pyrophosphatase MutT (NUDIX family)